MALPSYELLAIGVVGLVLVVFVAQFVLRTLRARRLAASRASGGSASPAKDRAYNRLALARREADLLQAQGGDVARARELIALSSRSLESREFDRSFELAQAAHETLVKARRLPSRPSGSSVEGASSAPAPAPADAAVAMAGPAGTATPAVPKNRVEAQFQLRLFEQELAGMKAETAEVTDARQLYVQAHAAFSRGDYAEAFRLSLRGRRRVGGHVESLAAPGTATSGVAGVRAAADPAQLAEQVAAANRCPSCGHPTVAGDAFCRGCGAAFGSSSCPSCGAPRLGTDTFCGKCGQRYG